MATTATVNWPSFLPPPTVNYSFTVESALARTQMDSGRWRQRKRFTRSTDTISVSWTFTDAQFAYFRGWFDFELDYGAKPFNVELALSDGLKQNVAIFVGGVFTASYTGHFDWSVSASLEVQEPNIISDDYTLFIKGFELSGIDSAAQSLLFQATEDAVNNNDFKI